MDGEPHHIIVAAADRGDGGGAYPFLNAIGAGFVKWLEAVDIEVDLGVGERGVN